MLPSILLVFKLFTHEEKVVSVWREADNQTGIKHNKTLSYQIKEGFTEPCSLRGDAATFH